MSRMKIIKEIEKQLFDETHAVGFDKQFEDMDHYVKYNYMNSKSKEWKKDKITEEYNEAISACKDLQKALQWNYASRNTIHHVIEEISDWILATSDILEFQDPYNPDHKYDEDVLQTYLDQGSRIRAYVDVFKSKLPNIIHEDPITADNVFKSSIRKIEEYAAALNAYDMCRDDQTYVLNPLSKMLRRLYTNDELRDPKLKDKIIKELRRMRFALTFDKNGDLL